MTKSKIDTIHANLENNLDATVKEIERLMDYKEEQGYLIRDIEDRIFDIEHGYFDEPVTHEQACIMYRKALEDLNDARELFGIIQDSLASMIRVKAHLNKALEAMDYIM